MGGRGGRSQWLRGVCPHIRPAPSPPAGTEGGLNWQFGFVAAPAVLLVKCSCAYVPCGAALVCPHIPPAPSPPAGTKGSLNSQFDFVAPTTVLLARGCDALLVAYMGGRGGRSQWLTGGSPDTRRASRCRADRRSAAAAVDAHDVRASERARSSSGPFGRAEQRSGARIRAGACLSEASLRPTPSGASSARQPEGPRPSARLYFAYFSLAEQRKVSRPSGRNPVCAGTLRPTPSGASGAWQPAGPRSTARLFFGYFLLAKQKKVARPPGRNPAKSLLLRTVTQ